MIADEVTDASTREQLSIVLRYVDSTTLTVREDLVGFLSAIQGYQDTISPTRSKVHSPGLALICPAFMGKHMIGLATWLVQLMAQPL